MVRPSRTSAATIPAESYPHVFHSTSAAKKYHCSSPCGGCCADGASGASGCNEGAARAARARATKGSVTRPMSTPAPTPTTFVPSTFTAAASPTSSSRSSVPITVGAARSHAPPPPPCGSGGMSGSSARSTYSVSSSGYVAQSKTLHSRLASPLSRLAIGPKALFTQTM